ncbi:NAD(P)/FAD-dependent oxidoreductase [Chitinophaga filiformis]|uniref:NAD(P)/FAD-dependent oxidoreductase n=1 Tax=Chitinophaga filiformis TaxID=104663 RepID=UPI001F172F4F|nr:NAD(P)/FAD-dependent oxidoreductase [Chitinophaga filiformis]MCF6407872.1 NAD(P)/FAD-dependent oxidoreductase [Chitinophaga filiformis]
MPEADVIIVGGGLAGLTGALHLLRAGLRVIVIEKYPFPRHKVCGEYISNEVLPYLQWLGADPAVLQPARIDRVRISAVSGKSVEAGLPLGGFGVSRYLLDQFLMQQMVAAGGILLEDTVTDISFDNDRFTVSTALERQLTARFVIGAYGKRSGLDQQLSRSFSSQKSPWLAVKSHYEGDFPDGLVALHNFMGGYCGVSKVENNIINICYLVSYDSFRRFKNIAAHQQEVLYRNPHLKEVLEHSRPLFERPLTISQVSFAEKQKVDNHILMTGDTAGLIHPLCGNGMAMAIHSAKIAAEQILAFFSGHQSSRQELELHYASAWKKEFNKRMQAGKILSAVFRKQELAAGIMSGLVLFPALLPVIVRQTHGKPFKMESTYVR